MIVRIIGLFEPLVLALVGTVLLASLLPAHGAFVPVMDGFADAGIALLFFLHGAKLSREAIREGARNWKVHIAALATTFLLFPLFGLAFTAVPLGLGPLAAGLLFLTLLPSTVQSSIAFTAVARGNVAAAVCSASFSNLLGIFVTPLLVALLMSGAAGQGGISLGTLESIVLHLLVPFFAGHLLRPVIGSFVARHKSLLSYVDRGSILLVIYNSFGAAVREGLWHRVSPMALLVVALLCCLLLALVLLATRAMGQVLGLAREDLVVLQFCGSKKSLASGVPMAGVLFPAAQVGLVILPLMVFHQIQLIVCAFLARRYANESQATYGEPARAEA
ncbi:bile acid:sodium symporter family protein [Sphingobium sp. LSP13-1-1.1]|uniref:bile acid:sodium symporter family protein n=1 Tax=Sphingobium sp. LSP13-1-1.1 TaxID=3135234 RepID=UPI00342F2A3E